MGGFLDIHTTMVIGSDRMPSIGKYRNDFFWIISENQSQYHLYTALLEKAIKYGFTEKSDREYTQWVNKEEVQVLGEKEYIEFKKQLKLRKKHL